MYLVIEEYLEERIRDQEADDQNHQIPQKTKTKQNKTKKLLEN